MNSILDLILHLLGLGLLFVMIGVGISKLINRQTIANKKHIEYLKAKMNRPERHRLSMDVPLKIWEEIEKIAQKRNISITRLINQLLFLEALNDKEYE